MTTMARSTVDDLIDAAKGELEKLRVALHEQIESADEHRAAAEEFSHEAQQIIHQEDQ